MLGEDRLLVEGIELMGSERYLLAKLPWGWCVEW